MKDFIKESHVTGEQSQNLSRFEPVGGGGAHTRLTTESCSSLLNCPNVCWTIAKTTKDQEEGDFSF